MPKYMHYIDINFYAKENEELFAEQGDELRNNLMNKLVEFIGDISEKKQIKIERMKPMGAFDKNIYIISVRLEKSAKAYIKTNIELIQKNSEKIKDTIDEECIAYLRFDKKEFFESNKIKLVEHGDCIHVKIKLTAYPTSKEAAIKSFEELIK